MILLTDPTLVSINHIQQAHKQADNGFNDIVAQLYKEEFSKQEKAKEEHIKQAKKKAIGIQRIEEGNRKKTEQEAERVRKEQFEAEREAARVKQQAERERQEASQREAGNNQSNQTGQGFRENSISEQQSGGIIGNSWSEVSPEQASQYMASKTGVPASKWQAIIYAESTNNPYVTNQIGCYGYLQLHPVHGNVSGMTPQQYLDTAVGVFNSQGLKAWEVTTNGMVN